MSSHFYVPQNIPVKDVVHSVWQIDRLSPFRKEHIIPKGVVEIIFNFSDSTPISAHLGNKQYHLPNCFISGFNTAPIRLQLSKKQVFFGVTLQPLAARKIIGAPASAFSDILVDLTLLNATFSNLWHELAEQKNFETRVSIFSRWIQSKQFSWQAQEKLMNHFLCAPNQHDLSVGQLADSLCYSPRHLARKIFEVTGMNTEEVLLYKKYLHAVHLMHHAKLSLTEIAFKSNFSDQSHFIKSFKAYTHLTPGEYNRNKSLVKGHIFEDVR
jgi:AraC-like DNA-binding protein